MLKKTNTANSQIVTNVPKTSSIPQDFEPVDRRKQDEEKDFMFQAMGDSENTVIAEDATEGDTADDDSAYHTVDQESPEDRAMHEEDSQSIDE